MLARWIRCRRLRWFGGVKEAAEPALAQHGLSGLPADGNALTVPSLGAAARLLLRSSPAGGRTGGPPHHHTHSSPPPPAAPRPARGQRSPSAPLSSLPGSAGHDAGRPALSLASHACRSRGGSMDADAPRRHALTRSRARRLPQGSASRQPRQAGERGLSPGFPPRSARDPLPARPSPPRRQPALFLLSPAPRARRCASPSSRALLANPVKSSTWANAWGR